MSAKDEEFAIDSQLTATIGAWVSPPISIAAVVVVLQAKGNLRKEMSKEFAGLRFGMNERFGKVDQRFEGVDARLGRVDERVVDLTKQIELLRSELNAILSAFQIRPVKVHDENSLD